MNRTLLISLDLEVPLTQLKLNLEIFDLALAFDPCDEFNFQMNQCHNRKLNDILPLKFVVKCLIQRIKQVIDTMQPQRVVLVAHNGQQHDFLILIDLFIRFSLYEKAGELFQNIIFCDTLAFFQNFKKFHSGMFRNVHLDLKSLCDRFPNINILPILLWKILLL
jgi:hypothetical protein